MNEIEAYVAAVVGTLTGMTISEEEWNKLTDPELERTKHIFFKTPSGKRVEYIRADVLDEIKDEFISLYPKNYAGEPELGGCSCLFSLNQILQIIDKYKSQESEVQSE